MKNWDPQIRPLPVNARIYPSVQAALREDSWDLALTHNVHDLMDVREISLPKVFLVHGTLSGRILQDQAAVDRALYIKKLRFLLDASGSQVVYISELKREDWGIPGAVIRPAVDVKLYGGYRGDFRGILQVCNHLKARGAMMGWETFQVVCRGLPSLVVGDNRDLAASSKAKDWDDLKSHLRSFRLYLYTPIYPYEDGYNLALLEAMATGMPIATLQHPSSPIRDGIEGLVAETAEDLRERALYLLERPSEAEMLGKGARVRVESEFPMSGFRTAWQSLAQQLVHRKPNDWMRTTLK